MATSQAVVANPPDENEYEYDFENEDMGNNEESLRDKLRSRPDSSNHSARNQLCGLSTPNNLIDLSTIPNTVKQSIRRKSRLDLIKAQIPQPRGCVPKTALPSWYGFDMAQKIPLVPAPFNYIYYSRGKLGEALHRCHPFSVWDEQNQERVVGPPYTALHDPHAKAYMSKPSIKSFLYKQALINEQGDVYCSLREFNKFRGYLKTHFCDEVNRAVDREDLTFKMNREQTQSIKYYLSSTLSEGKQAVLNARRLRAKQLLKETGLAKMYKLETKLRHEEIQRMHWQENKARENLLKVIAGYEREKTAAQRLYRVRLAQKQTQRAILKHATMKDIEVEEKRNTNLVLMERSHEKFRMNWIDSKFKYCKAHSERNSQIEEAMRADIKVRAKKRQRRVEHSRAMMPAQIEKKKEAERRLWEIVRKFAMRWLEKVRRSLHAPKDVQHESVWIGKSKGVLDDTLKYLKEISGYEKMDDFVLNIIKLKRQIQHQIELEEAEEAAGAARAAANGDSSEETEAEATEN